MYELNPNLKEFWQTKARNKILFGGRCSSKSHDAAGISVYLASNFTLRIMCARRFQARISESVYTLVKAKIEDSPFAKDWIILKSSLTNKRTGSEFLFYGIEKNLSEIKSTEGIDILWLEEANYITKEHWEIIEPTIRKEGSEVWFVFNPDQALDFVYDTFVTEAREDTLVRHINWDENPWLTETMKKIIDRDYADDPKRADHIYGGQPRSGSDTAIIPLEFIEAAIDAHLNIPGWGEVNGAPRIGYDVADDGDDSNAMTHAIGNVCVGIEEWQGLEDELLKSCSRVWAKAREMGASITYDSIGVGATCGSKFGELNTDLDRTQFKPSYDAFNAGGAVQDPDGVYLTLPHTKILNKDHFENIKAQMWDHVAQKFRNTFNMINGNAVYPIDELISIDSSKVNPALLKKLKKELSVVKKDISGRGKFMAEKKEKLRDRGIESPNLADSFIMAFLKVKKAPRGFFDF